MFQHVSKTSYMTDSSMLFTRREQWESVADRLLDRALSLRSENGSLIEFSGPRYSDNGRRSDGFEGFARSFWLAACRMKHAGPARRTYLAERYREGLSNGWDTTRADAWPDVSLAQTMVECGSLSFGLWATKADIWDQLPEKAQRGLADYILRGVSRPLGNGNWLLFRVIAHAALRSLGMDIDPTPTTRALDVIDESYRGEGWYSDGGDQDAAKFDYYNAWSMNMYPLLWAVIEGDSTDPARTARYRARSAAHVETMLHLISADGAPLFQGRSLIYRAAMTSSMWAAELAGGHGLEDGAILRGSSIVLDYFGRHEAFAGDQASLGWHREFEPMTQHYSGPGSPLWLSKSFLGLLLPADAPAWTAAERPIPAEIGDFVRTERQPAWILQSTVADGIVRAVNHGTHRSRSERGPHYAHVRDDPDYARIAYSTATAPLFDGATLGKTGAFRGLHDNDVIIEVDGVTSVRSRVLPIAMGEGWAVSSFVAELPERPDIQPMLCRIASICRDDIEVRLAQVPADISRATMTGWMIADDAGLGLDTASDRATAWGLGGVQGDLAVVLGRADVSVETAPPGAFGAHAAYPAALFTLSAQDRAMGIALRLCRRERLDAMVAPRVSLDESGLRIVWPDGSSTEHPEVARLLALPITEPTGDRFSAGLPDARGARQD
jgi:hypothetical protein